MRFSQTYKTVLLLLLLLPTTVFGGNYLFRNIDSNTGLSSNNVKCILQDSYGFMWFGTKNGLNRYDGIRVEQYHCYDYQANNGNNNIGALYQDEHKNLWVGTDRGIYIYNYKRDKFTYVSAKDSRNDVSPDNWVQTITGDGKGNVWALLPDQGVFHFYKGKTDYYSITPKSRFKQQFPSGILVDKTDNVWVCSKEQGLYKFNKRTKRFDQVGGAAAKGIYFLDMSETYTGDLMLTTNMGLVYKYDVRRNNLSRVEFNMSGKFYAHALQCFGNDLWIGTQNGLYVVNYITGKETVIKENPINRYSLSDNAIYCIYKSKNGDAWIGTYFGGVSYITDNQFGFNVYGLGSALSSRKIRGLTQTANGDIWIGTEDAGLNVLNPVTGNIRKVVNLPESQRITLTLNANGNDVYVGFFKRGMDVIGARGNVSMLFNSNNGIYTYLKDSKGNEWLGMDYALYRRNAGATAFEHIPATGFDWIFCVFEARDGTIWIGTMGNGLWKYNPKNGKFKSYIYNEHKSNGLLSNCVNSIMQDRKGNLWLSTDRGGISRYNPRTDNFTSYSIRAGLPDNTSYDILEDKRGNLWFGTNQGLVKFNPVTLAVKVFTVKDGLPGNQFNYNSAIKAKSGDFYFGGIDGIVKFNPEVENIRQIIAPIYFTGLSVLNRKVNAGIRDSAITENIILAKKITLPYDKATFSLDVASPHYGVTGGDKYEYRLLPVNNGWVGIKQGQISFINLAPGTYTLQIRVTSNNQQRNREITIRILPPWYASAWAYAIYVLLIAAAIYAGLLWYRRRKIRQMLEERQLLKANNEKELYRSKVNFFTDIAHEIRTPLSLIDAPLEAIEDEIGEGDTKARKYLNITRQNTKRLMQLTEQILDFRKVDSNKLVPKPETVDVTSLVNEMADRFEPSINLKYKELIRNIDDEHIFACTDREMLTKIISNLLNNALKYARRTIILELVTSEDNFTVKVISDSDKISDDEKVRIFKLFYQGDRHKENNSGGVGIGLALSLQLAELLNGQLFLDDGTDEGNSFVLRLPANKDDIRLLSPSDSSIIKDSKQPDDKDWHGTLLLVEDDEALREFLLEQTNMSFNVITARDGQEALDKLRTMRIDIVVTDIMMPVMSGFELCRQMKQDVNLSYIPVVFITAKNDPESRIKGLQYGAEAYIEKPFSIKYLKQLVHSILDNRHRDREAFARKPFFKVGNMAMNKGNEEFMNKVIKLIEDNIMNNDFNVDTMKDSLFMSRSSLLRKIKMLFNLSPLELIRLVKLKKAAELIQQCKYRIGDIGYMVGIESPSYFSKLFAQQFGITPKDFEKECRSGVKRTFTIIGTKEE